MQPPRFVRWLLLEGGARLATGPKGRDGHGTRCGVLGGNLGLIIPVAMPPHIILTGALPPLAVVAATRVGVPPSLAGPFKGTRLW